MSTLNVESISHPTSGSNVTINGITPAGTNSLGLRNLIINGAMQVAQRGTTFTGLTSPTFVVDRFDLYVTTGTFSSEQSTTAPPGFGNSLKIDCTATATLGTSGIILLRQKFEGLNVQSIKKGTSDAQPITLSFWVRSNKTGTYISEIYDADNTRQVSKSYTINSADTWEHKTLTFPADTTGTLTNDNSQSIIAQFWLAAGTNYTSGTLNTSWNSITNANRLVGQVNFADSTDNEFYITGVQLEVGSVATPFEHRSYGDELARCQRYYWNLLLERAETNFYIGNATQFSSTACLMVLHPPVTMRTAPSLDVSDGTGHFSKLAAGSTTAFNTLAISSIISAASVTAIATVSGTAGHAAVLRVSNDNSKFAFSAEL